MSTAPFVDLSTLFGRVVAGLRQETQESQAKFSAEISWDRSLLSRIESGRNTPTFDNLFELEEAFLRRELIQRHGDLTVLVTRVAHQAQARGFRLVYGQLARPADEAAVAMPALDRIVLGVIDEWLNPEEEP